MGRVTQENDILIRELEGEVAEVQVKVTKIDTDLANLHQFCKIGKQCAKQCYFPPELFGGIKKDCAAYYHSNYWQKAGNPADWHQPMSAYKNGFGWLSCNGESDYWIGLDYMS